MTSALLAAILGLAPFPAWSQVGRIALEVQVAPTSSVLAGAIKTWGVSPMITTPISVFSPASFLAAATPQPRAALDAEPGLLLTPIQILNRTAEQAAATPEDIGRLYDSAPDAPDFKALSPAQSPTLWRPGSMFLKPAAAVVNAWRLSRRTVKSVTSEEMGLRKTLSSTHDAIKTGRLQDALDKLNPMLSGEYAASWFQAKAEFRPYRDQGHAYLRFIEGEIMRAYQRAHARASDDVLLDEARAARHDGTLINHEHRATPRQARNSGHCAHHALFNAIQVAVGFVVPITIDRFIERARKALNVDAETAMGKSGAEIAALERATGLNFGRDVGTGMVAETIQKWALLLGLSFESRGPPHGDAQWTRLLLSGMETLVGLRRPPRPDHLVYLLGAFDSPSRGARMYMVQDSGSGATDFYTADELSAVADEIQLVGAKAPVALP
ncbi:MAG: hypothetical protein AAB268_13245 [Elusimicrobiota bacterium]